MSRVLIIDDEPQLRRLLRIAIEGLNHQVFDAANGADGLVEAATRLPDVILLDLGLPDMNGVDVLRRLREWSTTPILILTVQNDADEKVRLLDTGADDYVTKPFETGELLARMRVLLRRVQAADDPVFESGSLRIDFAARQVFVGKKEVALTSTEYAVLRVLARNFGRVVTHRFLLESVWGPRNAEQGDYLRVFISHLRRKLGVAGYPATAIKTETGIGYRLVEPV